MPDMLECILCGSARTSVVEQMPTAGIARLYDPSITEIVTENLRENPALAYCRCEDCDLRYFRPPITGSTRYYDALQRLPWYYLEDKPEYQVAKNWVASQDSVLEIGCGSGAFSKHIRARYRGLEFSEEAVQSARASGLNVLNQPIEHHALDHSGEYDVVCAFQVLEHVYPLVGFIEASVRVLKEGGLLLYCVPSEDSYVSLMQNSALNMPPHHVTRWTDAALKSVARVFRLELISIEHEMLAEFHVTTYTTLVMQRTLRRVLGLAPSTSILDLSGRRRLLDWVAYRLGKVLAKGFDDARLFPRGHSVTAVFRKVGA